MATNTFDQIRASVVEQVRHRVWIISDLQQSDLAIARECLTAACQDFKDLQMPREQIWYLGDSVQGNDETVLRQMVEMQIELLQALDTPLIFTCGNHEFDPYYPQMDKLPLTGDDELKIISRELFSKVPGWRTSENLSDFYFTDRLG